MKKFTLYIFLLIISLSWSCKDDNAEGTLSMEYAETNCENPWDALPGSDNYLNEVRSFLVDNGVTVHSIAILNPDANEACSACNCLTNRQIVISTDEEDQAQAESFGFTPQ